MMNLKKFKLIQCLKCGQVQLNASKILKCKYCQKSTRIKQKTKFGLSVNLIKDFDSGEEATKYIKIYKNIILQRKKDKGFTTYGTMSETTKKADNERYLVGICAECHSDIYSDEDWNAESGKPMHDKCNKAIEEAVEHEFDSIVKTDIIKEHNDEFNQRMNDEF